MSKVKDLFKAEASNPAEIAMLYNGTVGFVIPEYQRQYDWSKKNIERLYYDILNGFERLSQGTGANTFTFLGTLIFVEENTKETDFSGRSLAVVDGQQRLTTLAFFACALCELLRYQKSEIDFSSIDNTISKWLKTEIEERLHTLYRCSVGSQQITATRYSPFPIIVRSGDTRGKSKTSSEYISPIGKFLDGFAEYFGSEEVEYIPPSIGKNKFAEQLAKNYQLVRSLVNNLNNEKWYEDTECERFNVKWARRAQCRNLFERLRDFVKDQDKINKTIEDVLKLSILHNLLRTLMFASYFCNYVVLTRVTTEDESAAFDIFDALNTTGELLTALETLKPRVINFEKAKNGYAGSESEAAFKILEEDLDERFSDNTSRKQSETKNLVVTFALYIEGKKLSKDLATQRNFLRTTYDKATNSSEQSARQFVRSLADTAKFRRFYWEKKGIEELSRFHSNEHVDEVQLLASFIKDTDTSLTLPILSRYWKPDIKQTGDAHFLEVLRAVTAFLVIRRAATGSTAGIDSDFRAIMAPKEGPGASRKFDLCAGVENKKDPPHPDELKEALKSLLKHKLKSLDKNRWIDKVVANPLYQQSREIVRFMILLAAHQSLPSKTLPGTWQKSGVKTSKNERDFFNYKTWFGSHYITVEHIAPESEPKRGWSQDLYKDNILRHTLGNLVLLPAKENMAIGNESWQKKKKFYLALTETTEQQQNQRIEEAMAAGITFSKTINKLLEQGDRLPLLDPLRDVEKWNKEVVLLRGKNTAELCWNTVRPWLD